MKKRFLALALAVTCLFSMAVPQNVCAKETKRKTTMITDTTELHGLWVSIYDFEALDLNDKSSNDFRANYDKLLKKAEDYDINAIFFQVRANDDAVWASDTFKGCKQFNSNSSENKTAKNVYKYDPLETIIDVTHSHDMEIHAWVNPFRVNNVQFLDPGLKETQHWVKKAVKELREYKNLDGIQFDDYFYSATEGYVSPSKRNKPYPVNISDEAKRNNINELVKDVCKMCHAKDKVFGISPQGSVTANMKCGADVRTWLSKPKYIDYLCPQIYWADNSSRKLYSDHLANFKKLHRNSSQLFIGLGLYRAGMNIETDPGWKQRSNNLYQQLQQLRDADADGFILFSARFLKENAAKKELSALNEIVNIKDDDDDNDNEDDSTLSTKKNKNKTSSDGTTSSTDSSTWSSGTLSSSGVTTKTKNTATGTTTSPGTTTKSTNTTTGTTTSSGTTTRSTGTTTGTTTSSGTTTKSTNTTTGTTTSSGTTTRSTGTTTGTTTSSGTTTKSTNTTTGTTSSSGSSALANGRH